MPTISSRCLQPGDIVLKTKPIVHSIEEQSKGKYCDNCLKPSDQLKRCSKCRQMYYCGKNCQKIDWIFHKNECNVFNNQYFNRNEATVTEKLFLRLYLRFISDETFAAKTYQLIDGSEVSLKDIKPSDDERVLNPILKMELDLILNHFSLYGIKYERTESVLHNWFGLSVRIKFGIYDYNCEANQLALNMGKGVIAYGICLQLSSIKQSCLPNSALNSYGLIVEVRAIKEMSSGCDISMASIDLCNTKENRQNQFKLWYSKSCECVKCVNNLDKHIDYGKHKELLAKSGLQWIFPSAITNSDYEIDSQLISLIRDISGDYHPDSSTQLLFSFVSFVYSKKSNKSSLKKWFEEVDKHLMISHGSEHPVYKMFRQFSSKMNII